MDEKIKVAVTCFKGLEEVLATELRQLEAENVKPVRRAVEALLTKEQLYRANLALRTALRVLVPMAEFACKTEQDLYNNIYNFEWEKYLDSKKRFAIDGAIHSKNFRHSQYAIRKAKDALVDRLRDVTGSRPSVMTDDPDLRINLRISNDYCTLSFDSSGDPLYKRGYRAGQHPAQLNECLAAGMILLSGWDGKRNFVDPMCGSGTLPIEAALYAYDIAPGLFRSSFGFEKWRDFDSELYSDVVDSLEERVNPDVQIFGGDVHAGFVRLANENAKNAFVRNRILFIKKAFEDFDPPEGGGILIINPPYGERLKKWSIDGFYQLIGNQLKQKWAGYDAFIFSSNTMAMKRIGLKPSKKFDLYNGPLECQMQKFELYQGSKKAKKNKAGL